MWPEESGEDYRILMWLACGEIRRLREEVRARKYSQHERGLGRADLKRAHEQEVADLKTQLETALRAAAASAPRMRPLNPTPPTVVEYESDVAKAEAFLADAAQEADDGPVVAEARHQLRATAKGVALVRESCEHSYDPGSHLCVKCGARGADDRQAALSQLILTHRPGATGGPEEAASSPEETDGP